MEKILSEHIALTPIQAFLESESWGFYRGVSTSDNLNCCINADYAKGKDKEGGLLTEDALSADILMSMAFIEPAFISGLLKECGWKEGTKRDKYEVVGVQSNFWYPQLTLENLTKGDSEDNHLRLAQPDGWIAGDNLLIMIEAKGMRDGAAFNYAQLAKEYLIAKQECPGQPRILLLLTEEQIGKINKKGGLVKLFEKSWEELKVEKPVSNKWSETKVKFFNGDDVKKSLGKIKPDEKAINACFKILSYEKLKEYAKNYKTKDPSSKTLATMIDNTIAWHTPEVDREETITVPDKNGKEKTKKITYYKPGTETPSIWSKMLMALAEKQTPLYEFYTGGTINEIVTKAENDFFNQAAIPKNNSIRETVEKVRSDVLKEEKTIENFYRLYCIQKYWELSKEYNQPDKSDTVKYNYEKFFDKKYNEEIKKLDAQECREQLRNEFNDLNGTYNKKFGDQTGIVPAATPNVRYLLYFYVRSLLGFDDAMLGYDYFGFDNKKFFVKK